MTGIDPPGDLAAAVRSADPNRAEATADERAEDEQIISRIERLPRDMGWMMVFVGALGVALPGIIGAPFLIAGIAMLAPGGPKVLLRWAGREPSGFMHIGLKQMSRWLDDLERRYPRMPSAPT